MISSFKDIVWGCWQDVCHWSRVAHVVSRYCQASSRNQFHLYQFSSNSLPQNFFNCVMTVYASNFSKFVSTFLQSISRRLP